MKPLRPIPCQSARGEPEISSIQTPGRWVINSHRYHLVRLQLDLPESVREDVLLHVLAPPTVLAVIQPLDNEDDPPVVIQLLDDGSQVSRFNEPDYMDSLSRDAVPGDFSYSASINSRFTAVEGDFEFQFLAGDFSGTPYEGDILYPSELPPVGFLVETSDTVNVGIIDLTPSEMNVSVGRYWSFGSDYYRLLTVDIQLPLYVLEFIESGEIEPPEVTARIWREGQPEEQGVLFQLLDDGGAEQPVSPPFFQGLFRGCRSGRSILQYADSYRFRGRDRYIPFAFRRRRPDRKPLPAPGTATGKPANRKLYCFAGYASRFHKP